MKTYTYTEARQRLATLLDEATRAGKVQIRRRDGRTFVVALQRSKRSPLDVPGVPLHLRRGESLRWIDDGRRASERSLSAVSGGRSARSAQRRGRGK